MKPWCVAVSVLKYGVRNQSDLNKQRSSLKKQNIRKSSETAEGYCPLAKFINCAEDEELVHQQFRKRSGNNKLSISQQYHSVEKREITH